MRSSRLFFGLILVVVLSTTFLFVRGTGLGPRFLIVNNSTENVTVTAAWRDQTRTLGPIGPAETVSLTVRDEASMVFTARYTDGSELAAEPVYFTSGITTSVSISADSIDVQQDVGP